MGAAHWPQIHFYGLRNAAGELVPNGGHDDLLELDIYRLQPTPWRPAAAHDYTPYVMASQVKCDGASFVHPVGATAFPTYDMFVATTPTGLVEGGLQLDARMRRRQRARPS